MSNKYTRAPAVPIPYHGSFVPSLEARSVRGYMRGSDGARGRRHVFRRFDQDRRCSRAAEICTTREEGWDKHLPVQKA